MVTVTPKQYATLQDPKVYQRTKYGIPASNNIQYALDTVLTDGCTHGDSFKTIKKKNSNLCQEFFLHICVPNPYKNTPLNSICIQQNHKI